MTVAYESVLFDLFGTLVPPFNRTTHHSAIAACALRLEVDFEECHNLWVSTFAGRIRGHFASVAENFAYIARSVGAERPASQCEAAAEQYMEFTRASLQPSEGVVGTLGELVGQGVRLGLVTNCAPDVAETWPSAELSSFFSAAAFSCSVGASKPDPAIYKSAINALGIDPSEALYVGDGSDTELSGAEACGLTAILVRADLSDTYDQARQDVDGWNGMSIEMIGEVPGLIAGGPPWPPVQ